MPLSVFPFLGSTGYGHEHGYSEIVHENKDGSYRRFREASFDDQVLELNFEDYSEADAHTITTFCNARQSSTTDYEFYVYSPYETKSVDLTGTITTGRHRARLAPNTRVRWESTGKARYATKIAFKLLD